MVAGIIAIIVLFILAIIWINWSKKKTSRKKKNGNWIPTRGRR